jgi:hypothetical protein
MSWMDRWRAAWRGRRGGGLIRAEGGDGPRLCILSAEKRNQNYYRDRSLVGQAGGAMLTEAFDGVGAGWEIQRILARVLPDDPPAALFVSYQHGFTNRIQGLERLRIPKIGFVGDSYDFLGEDAVRAEKTAWFRRARFDALVSVYPHTDEMVWRGLGSRAIPILHSAWAVDPAIFAPQQRRRRYDIASLGAHTAGKYPFRIAVREYLEGQTELRFFKTQRVGGHDGPRFARTLNRLRSCFTCCSSYRFTVMKYFEIPACGTLLFGEPTEATDDLGFRDGENFVAVTPRDFRERFRYYLREADPERLTRIAQAGRELILARHTWPIRAVELLRGFREVMGS